MEFPGLLIEETISMYYPTTKKEVEFSEPLEIPGRDVQDRATPGGISIGLDFWPWNFQGCHTILQSFQEWKLVFSRISVQWSYDTSWYHDSV